MYLLNRYFQVQKVQVHQPEPCTYEYLRTYFKLSAANVTVGPMRACSRCTPLLLHQWRRKTCKHVCEHKKQLSSSDVKIYS